MSYPSFQFHPSSPNTAVSSSPQQPAHPKPGGGGARVVRPATPASSSPIGKKTSSFPGASSQAKRTVLGSLYPNSFVNKALARRRQLAGGGPARTKVVSGYATPTSSSPIRPTSHPSSDDAAPSSPVQQAAAKISVSVSPLSSPTMASKSLPTEASLASLVASRPSTSKLAASSSTSKPDEVLHAPLPLSTTHTFLLGRTRSAHPLLPKQFNAIPSDVVAALRKPYNAILRLPLPRSAKHASRVHVVIELVQQDVARVLVLGQNGARVNGRRVEAGKTVLVDASKGGEVRAEAGAGEVLKQGKDEGRPDLRISFWGVEAVLQWPEPEDVAFESDSEETESEVHSEASDDMDVDSEGTYDEEDEDEEAFLPATRPSSSVLPPSSPPLSMSSSTPPRRTHANNTPSLSPSSSLADRSSPPVRPFSRPHIAAFRAPTVAPSTAPRPQKPSMPPPVFKPEPKEAPLPAAPAPPPKPMRSAPESIDLPSLLSSALVFSHVTSLAVPDLVRAVLETSPSLKEHGNMDDWEAWVHEEVNKGGMWGRVIRRGKDASGQPLLDQYFYDPSRDSDKTRATDLGSLMRPLRGTQRQGKTYFFKRPSTPGKKRK